MKKISFWAKNHKRPARFIIVASLIVLNGLGILTGILLKEFNVTMAGAAMAVIISVFIAGFIFYPVKNTKRLTTAPYYIKQKSLDFILAASAFCMFTFFGNRPETLFQHYPMLNATAVSTNTLPKDSILRTYKSISEFSSMMKDENGNPLKWKEKKKLLKEQVKGIKKADNLSDTERTLYLILSIVVALGLLYLVAALSCNLSCSGSDGAAALVAVGGTAVVVILLVIAVRAIYGRNKKPVSTTANN